MLLNLELIFLTVGVIGYPIAVIAGVFADAIRFLFSDAGSRAIHCPPDTPRSEITKIIVEFYQKPSLVKELFRFVTLMFKVDIGVSIFFCVVFFLFGV